MTERCFHCEEPIARGVAFTVRVDNRDRGVCCSGCQAVAQLILEGGNGDFYRYREGASRRLDPRALECLQRWRAFDQAPAAGGHDIATTPLLIEGLHCGACVWLIEKQLAAMAGVESIDVDLQTGTATLSWRPAAVKLSDVLIALVRLGYEPHPLEPGTVGRAHRVERDRLLRRLAVAGLGMMQVMMFAVATWAGALEGIDPAIERLLLGVSMLVAAPVVFYAGAPFLTGALRAIAARRVNMDVPVAIALVLAFGASCINYFSGQGATYFESVSMFVFFLLSARFVAMLVRHRSLDAQLALAPMLPSVAMKLDTSAGGGGLAAVPRQSLISGDRIRVRAGEAVAADGVVWAGQARVDESLLTGESAPVTKRAGDRVLAGSFALDGSLDVDVQASERGTRVARIAASLPQVRGKRPAGERLSDQVAGWFVLSLLAVAAAVGIAWWAIEPSRALGIVLAVLVVTCPCALSLAIPTARSAAATLLSREGLLVQRPEALDSLDRLSAAMFDKTGTLSRGAHEVAEVRCNDSHVRPLTKEALLSLVAAIERHSAHPLARAFEGMHSDEHVSEVRNLPGRGLSARVDGRRVRIGSAAFVRGGDDPAITRDASFLVSDQHGLLGAIVLRDLWRRDAKEAIAQFEKESIATQIVSGDQSERVARAVRELGLSAGQGGCLPEQKLAMLRRMQRDGQTVLAVGDGVNDAALLAGADVSVAVASGAELAQSGADIVLTGQDLRPVAALPAHARRLRRTIRQNVGWAVGYNLLAVPLAALGFIGPGLAALGMSLSSILVVANSARIAWRRERTADTDITTREVNIAARRSGAAADAGERSAA